MTNYTVSDIFYILQNKNMDIEQLCNDTGLSEEDVSNILNIFDNDKENNIRLAINICMKDDGTIETNFLFDKNKYKNSVDACEHIGEFLYMITSGALISNIFSDIVLNFGQEKSEKIIDGFVSASEIDNNNIGKPVIDTSSPITFGNNDV